MTATDRQIGDADSLNASPAQLGDRQRVVLGVGLLLLVSAAAFESVASATVLPVAVREIGSLYLFGWAFSAFMLASLVATIAASQMADRRGPQLPLVIGIALFMAGLCVSGLAPTMPVLIAGRALQGLGAGSMNAIAYVCLGRGFADDRRAKVLTLFAGAWILPALVGPAIAGIVADRLSWRLAFLGLLPLPPLALLMLLPILRRLGVIEGGSTAGRLRLAVRLAVGTGLLLAGLDLHRPIPAVAIVVVGVTIAVPALYRLLPAGTFTARPGLPAAVALRGLLTFGYFGVEAFLPLALITQRGLTTTQAGLVLTIAGLSWTGASWAQARMDVHDGGSGRRRRAVAGLLVLVVSGCLTAAALLVPEVPVVIALVGWGAGGAGIGLTYPTATLTALRYTPTGQEGFSSGSMQASETLSIALSAGFGGAVIGLAGAAGWPAATGLAIAFGIAVAGGALGLLPAARLLPATQQL